MRGLIVLALVILLLVFVGWITFDRQPGRSSINLETEEIKEDTQEALDSGARLLENTGDAMDSEQPTEGRPVEPAPTNRPIEQVEQPASPSAEPRTIEPATTSAG